MGAKILNKTSEEKLYLKVMKNSKKQNRLIINTIMPKFVFKNKNGNLVSPKKEVVY